MFFIVSGLRTLCFTVADISEMMYQDWLEVYQRASTALQNRILKLEESYELIEKVSISGKIQKLCVMKRILFLESIPLVDGVPISNE